MSCTNIAPKYFPHSEGGLRIAASRNDGYTIALQWDRAFPSVYGNNIGYNIYYSTIQNDIFEEGVKFVVSQTGSIEDGYLTAEIPDLTPGEMYYFAVRAFEYNTSDYNLNFLTEMYPGLLIYPESLLLSDISETDTIIPISEINLFPSFGIIQIGTELIKYINKDIPNNSLIVDNILTDRGYLGTNVKFHQVGGYDGVVYQDPAVKFYKGLEEENNVIQQEAANFSYPNYAYTISDGYKTVTKDLLTTDLGSTEAEHSDFAPYDYAGWHRTDPSLIIGGGCSGSYIGGELYCADSTTGVGRQIRGVSINEQSHQRLEVLLNETGEPCVLLRRQYTGIRCSCYLPTAEYPEHRCPKCYGNGFTLGYQQFFNDRRSDGRIMVRFGVFTDDLKMGAAGLESEIIAECWTLVTPIIKDRDVIVRYNEDGSREFYYEVLDVTRNKLFQGEYGSQKFKAQRIRKTDKLYQILLIDSTATIPQEVTTSIGMLRGPGDISIPHTHRIKINENITSISEINQTTSIDSGHNHQVINGIVQNTEQGGGTGIGHIHTIILP